MFAMNTLGTSRCTFRNLSGQSKEFVKKLPYAFPKGDTRTIIIKAFFSEQYLRLNEAFEKMEIVP